jgi:arginine/ornithine transport system substrate-binding protein
MIKILLQRLNLAALVAVTLTTASTAALANDWTRIRIGVEGSYPPFSQMGPDGKLIGFEIELAQALCAEMKAQCTLVQQDFDGMIPALQARKFDMIMASMSITEERRKSVDFSDKYYKTPNRFVVKAGTKFQFTSDGMKGRKIGVQRATINDRFVTDVFKQSDIVRYAKQDDAYLDLTAGRVDALVVDGLAAERGFLKTPAGKGYQFDGPLLVDPKYFGIGVGAAFRKQDAALRDKVNAAIKAVRANGTYQKIAAKYFDFDIYGDAPAK